jgi:hypothetical protein
VYMSVLIIASLVIIFYYAPKSVLFYHSLCTMLTRSFPIRYGRKSMLWYIAVCSMIGGISVSVTTGLGAAIVQTALGDNQVSIQFLCSRSHLQLMSFQFKHWFMYFLLIFVIITLRMLLSRLDQHNADGVLVTEVYYLNMALALFNTGTPPRLIASTLTHHHPPSQLWVTSPLSQSRTLLTFPHSHADILCHL